LIARLWWLVDKRALLVTAGCILAWRLLLEVPLGLVPPAFIEVRLQVFSGSGWFASIGAHSVPLGAYSIGVMGLGPYINALVITSLARVISARVDLITSAPGGGLRLMRWIRALTVLLAAGQAYGFTVLFQNVGALPTVLDWSSRLAICLQLTAGTAILLLIADVLDEHGLAFGNGALLLFAVQPVGTEAHRIADYIAYGPSFEALLKPFAIAAVFAVAMTAGTIAMWLAVRRVVMQKDGKGSGTQAIFLRLLASGVLRPPLFAVAIMFIPRILANYYTSTDSELAAWIRVNWTPRGPDPWVSVLYVAIESLLVIGFAYFVTAIDLRPAGIPGQAVHALNRLVLIGGAGLALLTVVAPSLAEAATRSAGQAIPIDGLEVAFAAVMILITVRIVERRTAPPELAVSPRYLP
jgi:preprotein translocase subunit SecY